MLTEDSLSDFFDKDGHVKKASHYEANGFVVADKENTDKLAEAVSIKEEKK